MVRPNQDNSHNPRFPEQSESGIDLSLIRESLRLPPWDRVRRNFEAMKGMARIRKIARRVDTKKNGA